MDLIDRRDENLINKIKVETLFCLMSALENDLISTYYVLVLRFVKKN